MMEWWWAYLILGSCVGFLAGLLGIGGGFVMVPFLAMIFTAKGFDPAQVLHLALGTGMATILFTSASSVSSHHQRKAVNWTVVSGVAPAVMLGTFCGALIAGMLEVRPLTLVFTALVYYSATRMLFDAPPKPSGRLPGPAGLSLAGGTLGLLCSFAAMGGAALAVPYLVRCNVRLHEAIGSAAAIGWPLALAGALGYAVSGWSVPALPAHTIGYIYLPALLWIVFASMATAPLGARVAHLTPARKLRKVFAILLFVLATRLLLTAF